MLSFARILFAVALLLLAVPSYAVGQTTLLGVTYGNQGWEMPKVQALETWEGKKNAVVVLFTNWDTTAKVQDNLFKQQLPAIWNHRNVPLITWEPFTTGSTRADIVERIAQGDYDGYISGWAARLRVFVSGPDGTLNTSDDRRAYLRLAHEMNGNWYPWGQAAPGRYIAMWLRVHQHFDALDLGPSHVQWVWSVNAEDTGVYRAEEYFPGDTWTNWIAVDGYNWGATQTWSHWQTPSEVLGPMVGRLRAISQRPLALTEAGTTNLTPSGANLQAKNDWITQLFSWSIGAGVRMLCWFNLDDGADFSIFGGRAGDVTVRIGKTSYRAYSAYKNAVQAPALVGTNPATPRLISDSLFAGQ